MATSHDPLFIHHLSCSPKISLKGKCSSRNDSPLKDVRQKHQIQTKLQHKTHFGDSEEDGNKKGDSNSEATNDGR